MSSLQSSGTQFWISPSVQVTATGDKAVFTPPCPVLVTRWGYVARSLLDVGAGAVFTCDWRPTAGSDTNRVNGSTTGTPTFAHSEHADLGGGSISTSTTDSAAGTGRYHPIRTTTNVVDSIPGPLPVYPGEELVFECTDAADTAGLDIQFFVEYEQRPFQGDSSLAEGNSNLVASMTLT